MHATYIITLTWLDDLEAGEQDFEFNNADDALNFLAETVGEVESASVTRDGVEIDEHDLPHYMHLESIAAEEAAYKGGMNI